MRAGGYHNSMGVIVECEMCMIHIGWGLVRTLVRTQADISYLIWPIRLDDMAGSSGEGVATLPARITPPRRVRR